MTTNGEVGVMARPAGFWRRVFARLFDILLLLTISAALLWEVSLVVSLAESYGWIASESRDTEMLLWTILGLVWLVVSMLLLPVLYYTLSEGACGRTLGKALFRIRVVADDDRPISYGRAFARLITLPYAAERSMTVAAE